MIRAFIEYRLDCLPADDHLCLSVSAYGDRHKRVKPKEIFPSLYPEKKFIFLKVFKVTVNDMKRKVKTARKDRNESLIRTQKKQFNENRNGNIPDFLKIEGIIVFQKYRTVLCQGE